jgi:hypothetical protein
MRSSAGQVAKHNRHLQRHRCCFGSAFERDNRVRGLCKIRHQIGRKEATMAGDNKTFDGDNARQGVTGHHVRHVLAFGVAAVVLAFILVAGVT